MSLFPQCPDNFKKSDIPLPRQAKLDLDRLIAYRYRVKSGEFSEFPEYVQDLALWAWFDQNIHTYQGDRR